MNTIKLSGDETIVTGTPTEMLRAMQARSFHLTSAPLAEYVQWVADEAQRMHGVSIDIPTGDIDRQSAALIDGLIDNGMAKRIDNQDQPIDNKKC